MIVRYSILFCVACPILGKSAPPLRYIYGRKVTLLGVLQITLHPLSDAGSLARKMNVSVWARGGC